MPRTKPEAVESLARLAVLNLAKVFHEQNKMLSRISRLRLKTGKETLARPGQEILGFFEELAICLPGPLFGEFCQDLWQTFVIPERALLDEDYYHRLGTVLRPSLREILLDDPRAFQDSSVVLEAFLNAVVPSSEGSMTAESKPPRSLHKVSHVRIKKGVMQLVDFEFNPLMKRLSRLQGLSSLTLQCLRAVEVDAETIGQSLATLAKAGIQLEHLDLRESALCDQSCQLISSGFKGSLKTLNLDNCPDVTVTGVTSILVGLRDTLCQFEAIRGSGSTVQNALVTIYKDLNIQETTKGQSFMELKESQLPRLTRFTIRNPKQDSIMDALAHLCPALAEVRVIFNAYEFSTDTQLDELLKHLTKLCHLQKPFAVELDISCMNLLFAIQMRRLAEYGGSIRALTLTQCQFVHPQTLNPFALNCPNLERLSLYDVQAIPDNLFVGQVPDLAKAPFSGLRHFTYEGSSNLPLSLATFLLSFSSETLESIHLAVEHYTPDVKATLRIFEGPVSMPKLETLTIAIDRFWPENTAAAAEPEVEDLERILNNIITRCPALTKIEVFVRIGSQMLARALENLYRMCLSRRSHWCLQSKFSVKKIV